MSRRCPACRGAMVDLSAFGVNLGPRICVQCWTHGCRWRDVRVHGCKEADAYAFFAMDRDPPVVPPILGGPTPARLRWAAAGMCVAMSVSPMGIPLARVEGPTRGR